METVVGDISGVIQQHESLVRCGVGFDCCDELTRGVVGGVMLSTSVFKSLPSEHLISESTVLVN